MKYVKGKLLEVTEAEYKNFVEKDGKYILDLVGTEKELNEEKITELFNKIRDGSSKNMVCGEYNISEIYFNSLCRKKFGTQKITDIRDGLKKNKILKDAIESK